MGGAASLLDEVRADELEACRRLLEALEKRAAILELLGETLGSRRPFVRVGVELDNPALRDVALVGASYGLSTRTLGAVSLVGPLRMDYEKAIRSVRAAAHELSRFVEAVYEDDERTELLRWRPRGATTTRCSASAASATEAEIKRAFRRLARELHPDVSRRAGRGRALQGGRGGVRGALEVRDPGAVRPLRARGPAERRVPADRRSTSGTSADIFSAFFGDDVFGVATGPRRARGADIAAEVEIELEEAATGVTRAVPVQVAMRCAECGGDGVQPGTPVSTCADCAGAGRIQHVTRTAFGEFIRTQACARCRGSGRIDRASVRGLLRRGTDAR